LLKRGRFALTAEMAYMYAESRQNPPCPEARIGLATLAYAATMNDILSSTAVDQGYSAALRWLEAERRATVNGVPETQRMSLAAIVVQASNVGAWELARRAFLKAWDSGLASAYDLSTISQYYAITRNLGRNLAFKGSLELRKEGIRYLATAHALAVAYGLPNRDACADLRGLGYTDCSQVSPDPLDPVLAAARK